MPIVLLYYIISTLVYFLVGTGSLFWAAFNMVSIMTCFSVVLIFLLGGYKPDDYDKGWIGFAMILSFMRGLYTLICTYAPTDWIYNSNKIFAIIFTICLIMKMLINLFPSQKQSGTKSP